MGYIDTASLPQKNWFGGFAAQCWFAAESGFAAENGFAAESGFVGGGVIFPLVEQKMKTSGLNAKVYCLNFGH